MANYKCFIFVYFYLCVYVPTMEEIMKKKIAIILCIMFCIITMFGCSSTELGYLDLYNDMANIKSYQLSGNTELYYDAEGIKDFILKNSKDYDSKAFVEDELKELTGKKTILLDYNGNCKMEDKKVEYYLDLAATVDGKKTELGDFYISSANGIYVERDMIINLYKLSKDLLTGYKDSYFYSEDYEKELKAMLGTSEYIEIISAEDLKSEAESFDESLYLSNINRNKEINDKAIELIKTVFKGYSSGAVTSVSGGYKLSVNGDKLITIASDCLGYLYNNIDDIISNYSKYTDLLDSVIGNDYEEDYTVDYDELNYDNNADSTSDYEMSNEDRAEIAGEIAGIKAQLDYMYKKGELDIVKPFSFNQTIKKSGNNYICESALSMDEGSRNLGHIKSNINIEPKTINIQTPKVGTPIAEIMNKVSTLEYKYNPVKKVEISWEKSNGVVDYEDGEDCDWDEEYNWCDIYCFRDYDTPLSNQETYDYCEYKNVNKEMYVPLRQICEYFGEQVEWDNKAKVAYILKDNKKVYVKGILDTKTVFVRVRDFEKLGYSVKYDGSDPDLHSILIQKK